MSTLATLLLFRSLKWQYISEMHVVCGFSLAQGIERNGMGHLRRIACAGRTRYVIGMRMRCRGADQKGCRGALSKPSEQTPP